ncbi:MAG: inositol monophosphatase family protein [Gammaproteobacteria bacterium]|nr:inositol monophosphatase family protein [Gammaproteobacteria bacterium]
MKNNPFLDIALQAAKAGEEVIRHYYDANVKVTMKEDYTPVTVADVETEQKIKEVILGAFPEHGFYGEETGKTNPDAEYTWLIDPIDGTKSFVRQYPFFSTQIALMHRDRLIVGVSNGVMFNELAWASEGEGAYLNDQPIHVSDINELRDAALSMGNIASLAGRTAQWQGAGALAQQVNRTRGYGDFYHYHLLASGKIEIIVESDVNILDIAALSVIVKEAGGAFTDLNGQALNLDTRSVLATSNQTLYQKVYQMLHD